MRFIKTIFNIIIFLILFILIMIAMFIQCSKTFISKDNISEFISDANILNIDVNILFNQEESGITLKQKIYDLAIENDIPDEITNDMLESKEINELLGDFFNQTIIYIIEGGEKPQISNQAVENIKKTAKISLDEHLNIMIEEEELNSYIDNYCLNISSIVPDRNLIVNVASMDTVRKVINFELIYIYIAIILVLILPALSSKKFYTPIKYLGISMFIAGITFVILGSMEFVISGVIIENLKVMIPFIKPLITNVLTIWFKSGVLISFTSIVLILIYVTINKMTFKQ